MLVLLKALRTHYSTFPLATWDNSNDVAASLCGIEIWAAATMAAQVHSGDAWFQ
jgi:hypothetical protein